jgi:hypothetical protein
MQSRLNGGLDSANCRCADNEQRRRFRIAEDKGKLGLFLEPGNFAALPEKEITDLYPTGQVRKSLSDCVV